ncbi:uncharacterized protein LOC134536259 [Bacillus rossius redtenbacheri]|uniref:uncharacterized protein LOC134536259 n=1 Tax=Bacillus rossius redtenbacheri TaxID=93214 RepID=UPI002FDD788C
MSSAHARAWCGLGPRGGALVAACCHLVIGFVASVAIFHVCASVEEEEDSSEEYLEGTGFVLITTGLEALIRMVLSMFLAYAIYQESRGCVLLWLLVNSACLGAALLWMLAFMVLAASSDEDWLVGFGLSGADAALRAYSLQLVHRYYSSLRERNTGAIHPRLSQKPPENAHVHA